MTEGPISTLRLRDRVVKLRHLSDGVVMWLSLLTGAVIGLALHNMGVL